MHLPSGGPHILLFFLDINSVVYLRLRCGNHAYRGREGARGFTTLVSRSLIKGVFSMRTLLLAASSLVAALAVAAGPAAASIAINFDALQNDELVNGFYDGGFGSLGSGPGPNDGITFTNALVLNADENNEGLLVTPPNTIPFTSGTGAIMDDPAGFTTGFSFNYSAYADAGAVTVWSGLDGTGTLLATLTLPTTPNGIDTPGCNRHNYCPVVPFGVTFSGVAESVNFGGTADFVVYDDITLGSSTPITGVPESSTWAMMLAGFAGVGLLGYRKTAKARLAA